MVLPGEIGIAKPVAFYPDSLKITNNSYKPMGMESLDTTSWKKWQLPYEHGTLNIWPPDSVRQYVNKFREEHDPVSQAISEAHITMTQPFLRPPTREMWNLISNIAAQHEVFELQYGPVRSFLPAPVIWLDVQPSAPILSLRNALHETGFFNLTLPHTENFTAHMTLTEGLSGKKVDEKLLNRLSAEVSSGKFTCAEISYVRPSMKFQFSVHKEIPLGSQNPRRLPLHRLK